MNKHEVSFNVDYGLITILELTGKFGLTEHVNSNVLFT